MLRTSPSQRPAFPALISLLLLGVALSGCNLLTRLSEVGEAPKISAITNPVEIAGRQADNLPMPQPKALKHQANSLWRPGSRAFFKDTRATEVGDIITVVIQIDDEANFDNRTQRDRVAAENAALSAFLGFEAELSEIFPDAIDPTNLVDADSDSNSVGDGSIERSEVINLRVAAIVTEILPNGNFVIAGRQETRVNYEMRQLQVAGIIRPVDITSVNTIDYDQIAEARIAYGGRGQLSDLQQPRYGQQVYDILWPF